MPGLRPDEKDCIKAEGVKSGTLLNTLFICPEGRGHLALRILLTAVFY